VAARSHVVGAGLAGLAAALALAEDGAEVHLYEAAPQAGGRCRSYFDRSLGVTLDNGNHLVLSGNSAVATYLARIGASDRLVGPERALYPFFDLESGERYALALSQGRIPWWIFSAARRVPGSRPAQYLRGLRLARAGPERTVADCLPERDALWRGFYEPLAVAALNTRPEEASARLLWRILAETFLKGGAACRPRIARHSLADTFVDPALQRLGSLGARLHAGWRLRRIDCDKDATAALHFDRQSLTLGPDETVILALPPWNLRDLLPELDPGLTFRPIVNAHLLLPETVPLPADLPLLGLLGGTAEWLFARGRVASLTVSAAEALDVVSQEELAARLWRDTAAALSLPEAPMPPIRIVREKRATFAATPDAERRRPGPATRLKNLFLAGDWTDTGLPATIEGAIRSGFNAARAKSSCSGASA